MDREVILSVEGEEVPIGYVSEFIAPRTSGSEESALAASVFEKIREAIMDLDLEGVEQKPIIITIS